MLHFRSHHYRYDEHGRTASKQSSDGTQHYRYDAEHRLSAVHIEQSGYNQRYGYVYDALGRRIEKHQIDHEGQPYNRTRFLWDGFRLLQETSPIRHQSVYIYTDQHSYEALARIDKRGSEEQEIRYFHTNLNGCPEELTDAEGKILWECSYQLWGKRIHEIEHIPIQQNLRYQGQYLDRETGLHYNTFRYYDLDIGRFTQPDPIGLQGGLNLYQYAPNGLTWIDPWGLHTSPTLPFTIIVKDSGVIIEHYYHGSDHLPAHAHVKGEGRMIRIGANGKPLKGEPELSKQQRRVVDRNISKIRRDLNKINRWFKHKNHRSRVCGRK